MDPMQRFIEACSDPQVVLLGVFVCGFFVGSVSSSLHTLADFLIQLVSQYKRK